MPLNAVTACCVSAGIGPCSTEMLRGKTDILYNICTHQLVACERGVIRDWKNSCELCALQMSDWETFKYFFFCWYPNKDSDPQDCLKKHLCCPVAQTLINRFCYWRKYPFQFSGLPLYHYTTIEPSPEDLVLVTLPSGLLQLSHLNNTPRSSKFFYDKLYRASNLFLPHPDP